MTLRVKLAQVGESLFDLRSHRSRRLTSAIFAPRQPTLPPHQTGLDDPTEWRSVMNDAQYLADRYVSVWIEADPDRRRQAIAEIWRPDGQHYVDVREARGYDALEQRIVGSYER